MVRQDNLSVEKVKMARNPQSFLSRSKNLNFIHNQVKKSDISGAFAPGLKSYYQYKVFICDPVLISGYSNINIHLFQQTYVILQ